MVIIKDIIFWLIYLGLAGTSVLFVHQTLLDFWNSKTFFVTSTIPLSSLDIPTLTICFKKQWSLTYMRHLNLTIWIPTSGYSQEKFVMQEDYNTFTDTEGTTHKIRLSRMSVGSFIAGYKRMCWKVSPDEMNIDQYIQGIGKITFDLAFKAGHAPEESLLYITRFGH